MEDLEWVRIDSDNLKGKLWVYGHSLTEICAIYCARDQPTLVSELNGIIEDGPLDRLLQNLKNPEMSYVKIGVNPTKKDCVRLNKRLFLDSDADILRCTETVTIDSLEQRTEEEVERYYELFFKQASRKEHEELSKLPYDSHIFMDSFFTPFRTAVERESNPDIQEAAIRLLNYAERKGKRFSEDIKEMLDLAGNYLVRKNERLSIADLYAGKIDSYMCERFGNAAAFKICINDWKQRHRLNI